MLRGFRGLSCALAKLSPRSERTHNRSEPHWVDGLHLAVDRSIGSGFRRLAASQSSRADLNSTFLVQHNHFSQFKCVCVREGT